MGKRMSGPKLFVLVLVLCTAWLTASIGGFILIRSPRLRVVEGFAPTYAQLARRKDLRLLSDALPPSAKEVCYRVYPHMPDAKASFSLEPTQFLEWARTRGWKPAAIEAPYEVEAYLQGGTARVTVREGYCWTDGESRPGDPSSWGWVLEVVYDSNKGEVYYSYLAAD